MFSLTVLIVTAIATLIAGLIIGAVTARATSTERQHSQDMEKRLAKAEEQLIDYQHQVSEHFADTSQLVNKLTQSYQEVHEHLASSALKLANPEISRQLLEAGDGTLRPAELSKLEEAEEDAAAPLDWAPKAPGQTGQLSEEFNLHEDEEDITFHPADTEQR